MNNQKQNDFLKSLPLDKLESMLKDEKRTANNYAECLGKSTAWCNEIVKAIEDKKAAVHIEQNEGMGIMYDNESNSPEDIVVLDIKTNTGFVRKIKIKKGECLLLSKMINKAAIK